MEVKAGGDDVEEALRKISDLTLESST